MSGFDWTAFVSELPDRIAQIRAVEAPLLCPTCGSTTPPVVERRVCSGPCGRELPLSAFHRNRATAHGRDYYCKSCRSAVRAQQWQRQKRRTAAVQGPVRRVR